MKRKIKATVSPLPPPRYALGVSEKHGHESPHAEGRTEQRACLITIDTKAFVHIARPDITAPLPERPAQAVRPADGIRGDPPHLEGSFRKTDCGAAPTNNLGFSHEYH
jgi:hypothetical protein